MNGHFDVGESKKGRGGRGDTTQRRPKFSFLRVCFEQIRTERRGHVEDVCLSFLLWSDRPDFPGMPFL